MPTITSADGTSIGFEQTGEGPALILIDGAMCYRAAGPMRPLAERLADHFTVYAYDRRGRGDSGDTQPYAIDREIEDLAALVAQAGGSAYGYGLSSGGALLLAATAAGVEFARLALYEVPFTGATANKAAYTRELNDLLPAGRRGDAVAAFMRLVGMPAPAIDGMRASPAWPMLEAIAPTLAYDDAVLGDGTVPREQAKAVKVSTLVLDGSASPEILRTAATGLADALPDARRETLGGQTHDVDPEALAPALIAFFSVA
jgi:pimeloyl-ACP methyl ester carboxylesterase